MSENVALCVWKAGRDMSETVIEDSYVKGDKEREKSTLNFSHFNGKNVLTWPLITRLQMKPILMLGRKASSISVQFATP